MRLNINRAWIVPFALFAYLALLVILALGNGDAATSTGPSVWELQQPRRLISWIVGVARTGLLDVVRFLPVGFLIPLVLPHFFEHSTRFLIIGLLAALLGIVLTILVRGFEIGSPWVFPSPVDLLLPTIGSLMGTWIGTTWLRGRRARLWLVPKLAVLTLIVVGVMGVLVLFAIEKKPLEFEGAQVTSAEKRRLVQMIREKNALKLQPGEIRTLNLPEHDLDVLISWVVSIGSKGQKAKIELETEAAMLKLSSGFRVPGVGHHYLNLRLGSNLAVDQGHLTLHLTQLTLGRINISGWARDVVSSIMGSTIRRNRRTKPFLKSIERLSIAPTALRMAYGRVELPEDFLTDLATPGTAQEVIESTRAQIQNLLASANSLPHGEARFGGCLETTFALAQSRSVQSDPALENRGAIFALGIVLGHSRLARFIGPVADNQIIHQTRQALGQVTIRERRDWTLHFLVSAALALLSTETVSDAVGLLKEELDAGAGGSGFSFPDLLADKAGTTFALAATRDVGAARAMQDRLAQGFQVNAFFPPGADLPEGIPDAEFQAHYGGVGGERYRQIIVEIEGRIANCDAYR
jgi:hypothetical protein